jgi:hypothetical protein
VAVGCAVLAAALLGAMLWLGKRPLGAALSSGSRVLRAAVARKTAP